MDGYQLDDGSQIFIFRKWLVGNHHFHPFINGCKRGSRNPLNNPLKFGPMNPEPWRGIPMIWGDVQLIDWERRSDQSCELAYANSVGPSSGNHGKLRIGGVHEETRCDIGEGCFEGSISWHVSGLSILLGVYGLCFLGQRCIYNLLVPYRCSIILIFAYNYTHILLETEKSSPGILRPV